MTASHLPTKLSPLALAISLTLASITTSASSYADTKSTEEPTNKASIMESIAIVGATTNTIITPEDLEKYQANDIDDIFRFTPSVTVGGSLSVAQKLYVRGLEDNILNVTVDGAPQTSSLFHHIGRVSIEPELLQSVEVQAGAGEATAGIGAIGGAIRFKTKTADDLLNNDATFGGIVKASYFSNDGHKESIALYGKATESVGILASYVNVENNNMEDGDGNEITGTAADQTLAFVKVDAKLTDNQNLTLSYEQRKEQGDFAKNTNWSPLEGAALFTSWGERETIVLNHTWYVSDLINLETTLYNTESSFRRELFTYNAAIETKGFDIRNTSELGDHSVIYGVEYKNDEVTAGSYEEFSGLYNEEGSVTAFYVQDHWQINEQLLASFGVRHDSYKLKHNAEKVSWVKVDGVWVIESDASGAPITSSESFTINEQDGFSINAGLAYNITDELTLSIGHAQALRGREIGDAFTLEQLSHNELLDAEEVINNELGLAYNDGIFILEASVYSSVIDDVIFDHLGNGVFYENIGDLETKGFELVAGYQATNFDVLVSYNTNDVELNNALFGDDIIDNVELEAYEYNGLGTTVGDSINVNVNYKVDSQLNMGFNVNHVSSVNNLEVFNRSVAIGWIDELETVNKPGYTVIDAFITYNPITNVKVNLAIQNLLDKNYRNHGSVADYGHISGYESVVGINDAGRDVRLSVSYTF